MHQARDDPVSPRKVLVAGLEARWPLGDEAAFCADPVLKFAVLGRINPIYAAGEYGDRSATERSLVSGTIDSACKGPRR